MPKYPSSIIPIIRNKPEIDINFVLTRVNPYVVRRMDMSKTEAFNRFGNLNPMALSKDEIPNMSMNLLGGNYAIAYLKFKTTGNAAKSWKKGRVRIKDYAKYIKLNPNYTELFIAVRDLHKKNVPFTAPDKKEYKQAYKGFIFEPSYPNNQITVDGRSEIKHDPTMLNYWHVILEIKDFHTHKPIKNAQSKFNSSACESMITNVFCVKATNERPHKIDKIDKYFYIV